MNLKTVERSQTLLINEQSKILEGNNQEIIKFGFGQSPFLPPQCAINTAEKYAFRKDYTNVQGLIALRKAVSDFHFRQNQIKSTPNDIFIAPGSKMLIFAAMACFQQADVLIPAPAWVSYAPQCKLLGLNPIRIETNFENRWRVTPHNLKQSISKKKYEDTLMILNYPGNPDGLTYTKNELEDISKVLEINNVLLVADEIYGLLTFENEHYSMANIYANTITTTGLSKWCGAGGWRLGVAILPSHISEEFRICYAGVASETYSCATTSVQMAAVEAYSNDDVINKMLSKQNEILKKVANFCYEKLSAIGVKLHKPQGAFYLFPDFENHREKLKKIGIKTSNDFCKKLLAETGVALLPGTAFGMETTSLTTRLAFVDFEPPNLEEEFTVEINAPKIVLGIQKIIDWLEK